MSTHFVGFFVPQQKYLNLFLYSVAKGAAPRWLPDVLLPERNAHHLHLGLQHLRQQVSRHPSVPNAASPHQTPVRPLRPQTHHLRLPLPRRTHRATAPERVRLPRVNRRPGAPARHLQQERDRAQPRGTGPRHAASLLPVPERHTERASQSLLVMLLLGLQVFILVFC